jgi:hypothetical protein
LNEDIVVGDVVRKHDYHAEATVLEGRLELPLVHEIVPQAHVQIFGKKGYLSQRSENFRVEGVISYSSAYTQVAGNRDPKAGHGWSTLSTSVIENLNVLDVLTADRVVAQVGTEHPAHGYIPSVTFLGTRFENLRISGEPVTLTMDLDLLGDRTEDDIPYLGSERFLSQVNEQYQTLRSQPDAFPQALQRYNQFPSAAEVPVKDDPSRTEKMEWLECSLVKEAKVSPPATSCGHIIDVPNFGKIYLATLRLEQSDFLRDTSVPRCTLLQLNMIELHLGCVISGTSTAVGVKTNGVTRP